jgi:hypothetical protein
MLAGQALAIHMLPSSQSDCEKQDPLHVCFNEFQQILLDVCFDLTKPSVSVVFQNTWYPTKIPSIISVVVTKSNLLFVFI